MMFVVDGILCDGGEARPQGWHRLAKDARFDAAPTLTARHGPCWCQKLSAMQRQPVKRTAMRE